MVQDVVLFEGIDANNRTGLWVTNGTAAGTFELTTSGQPPVPGTPPITGEAPYGFLPDPAVSLDLTVFNNQVLFVGRYGQTNYGLWTTDGTGAGTVQLANISGANAAGIFTQATSPDFTVYNGEVLFNGRDNAATPLQSLWTTNGTAAGTQEVTGINGAASTGVNPTDMTVFNGSVLFNGVDTAGHQGLWVTNGTGAGTQELTVGSTASTTGIDPTDMTVLNGMVLFNGVDANGLSGLWAWNGTSATELVAGGGTSSTKGLNPTDMTVFGNEVLFNGLDQNGDPQLWVTNGTVAGTYQLTGVAGANASASASGIAPSDLTVFNGEVLFSGRDTTGQFQLWETNGTVAGTQELTTAANGFRQGLRPSNLEVYDGQVLFSGLDPDGFFQTLWTTNGTAAGTHEILPSGSTNTYSSSFDPVDLTAIGTTTSQTPSPAGIVWRNASTGGVELWSPNGSGGFTYDNLGVVKHQLADPGDRRLHRQRRRRHPVAELVDQRPRAVESEWLGGLHLRKPGRCQLRLAGPGNRRFHRDWRGRRPVAQFVDRGCRALELEWLGGLHLRQFGRRQLRLADPGNRRLHRRRRRRNRVAQLLDRGCRTLEPEWLGRLHL